MIKNQLKIWSNYNIQKLFFNNIYFMFLNYKYRSTNKFVSEVKIKKNILNYK